MNKAIAAAVVTALIWASAFVAIRTSLEAFSPYDIALLRGILGALAFGVIAIFKSIKIPRRADLIKIALSGILGFTIYNVTLSMGEQMVSAGTASFIVNTVPLFATIMAVFFLGEQMGAGSWLGIGIGFAGVTVIALSGSGGGRFSISEGALLVLVAAICQATYFIFQKRLVARYGPLTTVAWAVWAVVIPLLLFPSGTVDSLLRAPSFNVVAVCYLGLMPTVLGFFLWSYALKSVASSSLSSVLYLVPLATLVIEGLMYNTAPTWSTIVGGTVTSKASATMWSSSSETGLSPARSNWR